MTVKKLPDEFFEKKICIFGTGGSGKTEFSKKLWEKFKRPVAYDVNGDFAKCKGGIAYKPNNIQGEIMPFIQWFMKERETHKIDALFFDDADAYIDYELMNDPLFLDLIIRQRNKWRVSLVFIGKRPQNLPTKITNNAQTVVVFKLDGVNAIQRIKDMDDKILPILEGQVFNNPFSYIVKEEGKEPIFNKAVSLRE